MKAEPADLTREVQSYWTRLEAWAGAHAPAMLQRLAGPATSEALTALERRIRIELPADLRASLLLHDGEVPGSVSRLWADGGLLLGTDEIVDHWEQMLDFAEEPKPEETEELVAEGIFALVEGPVHAVHFRERWIPWMNLNGDRVWYLDFDPPEGGTQGQVIEVDPECTTWRVVAPSYGDFLRSYVEQLEAGEFAALDSEGLPCRLADREAEERLEQGRVAALAAFRDSEIDAAQVARMTPGTNVEVVGFVTDSSHHAEHYVAIQGGEIPVRGELPSIYHDDDPSLEDIFLRLTIKIGKKSLFRRRAVHEVVSWTRL